VASTGPKWRSARWRGAAMTVVALGLLVVAWELVKLVVPDDGVTIGGVRVLPRTSDAAMPHVWTILATLFSAGSMISGLGSIYYTSVADAMVIYATVPFVTAGVAFLVIGEKASRSTLIASTLAFAGVAVMLTDAGGGGSMLGKGLAGIMTLTVAALAVIMRQHRDVPMLPAMAFSAYLCSAVTFWFASPGTATGQDMTLIFLFGIMQNALGLILYTFGARRIPAADASLIIALEVPLTPLWVWMFMAEIPPQATLIGGPIVLVALFGHIFVEFRRSRGPLPAAPQQSL